MIKHRAKSLLQRLVSDPARDRSHEMMMLNNKMLNYAAARSLIENLSISTADPSRPPANVDLQGKIPTQADIESPWMQYWCGQMRVPPVYHRKVWEFAFALQVLWERGMIATHKRGIGFGCGTEPIASVLAKHGVEVTVTDQDADAAAEYGWADSSQHAATLESAYKPEVVDRETFDKLARFRKADMRNIKEDLNGYDFCWSLCAFEHLGSIEAGLDFVTNAMRTLKPGGIAVHTTEFNVSASTDTFETQHLVLYQRHHIKELARRLSENGHEVCLFDFSSGDGLIDNLIDFPPFALEVDHWLKPLRRSSAVEYDQPHLKLAIGGYPTTSIGFWARHG